MKRIAVFDLDGTLLDSDEALLAPFVAMGIPRERVRFGLPLADECARLGVTVERYLSFYDTTRAQPYPGVEDVIARLDRWGICSNKHPDSGRAELARLGWSPLATAFAEPGRGEKSLDPVLRALRIEGPDVLFIGDTAHDRACAAAVGARFALASWNPRASAEPGDLVLRHPSEVLDLLR